MVADGKDSSQPSSDKDGEKRTKRRNFLRSALAFSVVLVVAGLVSVTRVLSAPAAPQPVGTTVTQTRTAATTGFPRIRVARLSDLKVNQSIPFNYPLEETPNFIVKLGTKAAGGVGPDSDIVAFSNVCQHLGCIYGYVAPGGAAPCNPNFTAPGPVGYCCCHGGVYDLASGGKVIGGPPPRPVPQVLLEYDQATGDIFAMGMTPPSIFGHNTGSNDVNADLEGGTRVG